MSFYRGGIEYFCSEWLTHRTETNGVTKSYSFFFFFNILEKEKNVSSCSFLKLGTENVNEWIKKNGAWFVCCCQLKGRSIFCKTIPFLQILGVTLTTSIFFWIACWMKAYIHLKYGRDRATHSFTSSSTPCKCKKIKNKVCIFIW